MNNILIRVPTDLGIIRMRPRQVYEDRWIVFVKPTNFCRYWAIDAKLSHDGEQYTLATGGLNEWQADRKYGCVDKIMRHSESIIPISDVNFFIEQRERQIRKNYFFLFHKIVGAMVIKTPCASFNDGITRFIWLMTQGAKFIPVECSSGKSAWLLHEYAGDIRLRPLSIVKLDALSSENGASITIDALC